MISPVSVFSGHIRLKPYLPGLDPTLAFRGEERLSNPVTNHDKLTHIELTLAQITLFRWTRFEMKIASTPQTLMKYRPRFITSQAPAQLKPHEKSSITITPPPTTTLSEGITRDKNNKK